uniref:Crystallin, gamma N2 n=1 Tax=Cyprinus carpio TaxID=7962 RepID=A0A8C2CT43_CYPCA
DTCCDALLQSELFFSAPQIVFYEGRCFTGRRLEVYGDCDNFQDRGFMNRVNSIRVESGAWICFDHPDFKGQQYILERGEYPEFQRWNSHNDHMGSCRPVRMHGEHYRMQLFEGCNYTGQCMDLCDDCPFLQSRGFNTNCINSVRVYIHTPDSFNYYRITVQRSEHTSCSASLTTLVTDAL